LGVLYGGLGISKLQFLIKKIEIKFPAIKPRIRSPESGSGIQIRNPDRQLDKMLDQCGSEILEQFREKMSLVRYSQSC
jgi:hypothetical protein